MVKRGTKLPTKLKSDAIVEAIFEIRFDGLPIPEVFFGRLVDNTHWQAYSQNRLAGYDMPRQLRDLDQSARFTPMMELIAPDGKSSLRLGPYVVSYHQAAPYVGWDKFEPALDNVIDSLFDSAPPITIRRLGLRYLNALSEKSHHIKALSDLDLKITIADDVISDRLNINFTRHSTNSTCTVRVATLDFVQGAMPPDTTVVVDVDVYTDEGFTTVDKDFVKLWVKAAHEQEKTEFFHLFQQATINLMTETE